jgi:hypothetical protein
VKDPRDGGKPWRGRFKSTLESGTCLTPSGRQKKSYRSMAKARQALRGNNTDAKFIYLCPLCSNYHLSKRAPYGWEKTTENDDETTTD